MTIYYYIINQKRTDFMGQRPPRETRRHLYQTRVSTYETLCRSGVLFHGRGGTMLQRQKTESVAI